mgnify:FL=1
MKKFLLILLFIPLVFACSKDPVIFTLTTSANPADGGTVSPSSKEYNEGETATINASPNYSYEFLNWSGGFGVSNSTTLTMDSDKSIIANFSKKTPLKIKFELEENWAKVVFPNQVVKANIPCNSQGGNVDVPNAIFRMFSKDLIAPTKNTHYSIDSLIIDLRKFDNTDVNGKIMEGSGLYIRKTDRITNFRTFPKKIGYIKIIGDISNKKIFWDLTGSYLPMTYGDSNIDFSNLMYKFWVNGGSNCVGPTKISDNFSEYFIKGDVSKPKSTITVNFSSNIDNYNIGDLYGGPNNDSYKILSKSYEYD